MSIVLQLQKNCINKNITLQELLREALLISRKLKLKDFKEWIDLELNGYTSVDTTPKYRNIAQILKFKDRYHGWVTAQIGNELYKLIGKTPIMQSIGEIEHILSQKESTLSMSINGNDIRLLQKQFKTDCEPCFFIDKTQIYGIVEKVRNLLLDWSLQLEEDGILGTDDLIFSEKEKESAKLIHIEHFNGVLGDIDKVGNMSTGNNTINTYNENDISNEIDRLILEIKTLHLKDEKTIVQDLKLSKEDKVKAQNVLSKLLSRGSEIGSIGSFILSILNKVVTP